MNEIEARAAVLFEEQRRGVAAATDRIFLFLMPAQWAAALIFAFWLAPLTWSGPDSRVHVHVYAAILLGGTITLFPMLLARVRPGAPENRFILAAAQVAMGILLIDLSGGRIETHFHVFGSLAILAFYLDWRVLAMASVLIAADHFVRGLYWPQSAYGAPVVESWRFLEHGAWVVFEDVFLLMGVSARLRDMKTLATRQAELEALNERIERKVAERTRELEQSQARMRQAEKLSAVGQLAAGVAHEINNPLGVILGFSQGMSRRLQDGDPHALPIRSIEREAKRCKALVQNLLTFARTSHSERSALSLNATVEQALSLISPHAKLGDVRVAASFAADLPLVLGNKTQLEQVIMNLAKNAIDAMPGGGALEISTDLEPGVPHSWVRMRFTDDGTGIPENVQAKIFDPFFTTKPIGQGTGLGLSLVSEIVQKHSGDISVESRPGRTTFTVRLPARSGEELEAREREAKEERHQADGEARGTISHVPGPRDLSGT